MYALQDNMQLYRIFGKACRGSEALSDCVWVDAIDAFLFVGTNNFKPRKQHDIFLIITIFSYMCDIWPK